MKKNLGYTTGKPSELFRDDAKSTSSRCHSCGGRAYTGGRCLKCGVTIARPSPLADTGPVCTMDTLPAPETEMESALDLIRNAQGSALLEFVTMVNRAMRRASSSRRTWKIIYAHLVLGETARQIAVKDHLPTTTVRRVLRALKVVHPKRRNNQ